MSAPKNIAKRQKLERKRRRKQAAARQRQSRRQFALGPSDFLDSVSFARGPVGGIKMSAVLEDFIDPLLESATTYQQISGSFALGVVAWNAALEPADRRAAFVISMIDEVMKRASHDERQECRELIEDLIARKLQHFDHYRRPILSFHLEKLDDGGFYVSVASALC